MKLVGVVHDAFAKHCAHARIAQARCPRAVGAEVKHGPHGGQALVSSAPCVVPALCVVACVDWLFPAVRRSCVPSGCGSDTPRCGVCTGTTSSASQIAPTVFTPPQHPPGAMVPEDDVEEVQRDLRPGTYDANQIIGETPEAMEQRALFAGWATECRRMCRERDEDQFHLYAFCAVKCVGSFLAPVILDELRGSGGESPDGILTWRLMEIYLKLGEKLGISCGVVPVSIINKIKADPASFPPAFWPASTVGDLSDQRIDILIVGDSSIATMGEGRALRTGSFLEELLVFTNRRDSGVGTPQGLTHIQTLPGGGVRAVLICINQFMQDLRARGRAVPWLRESPR